MGAADKHGSKGGGKYVGSFLQLFDWNAKSRKKLFSTKSELPERSKQGKKYEGNTPMTRLNLVDEDAAAVGGSSSIRGSSDYSCASSMTEDESYVSKPPGVVARLMGLDSLPTSNFSEPFLDPQSLRDSHYPSRNLEFHNNRQISHSGNLINRVDDSVRSTFESKPPSKTPSRPIEKFQSEVLPPKSTKSISITHHKLLSPIKNPGYNYNKNAAHIMEAAAKIIEPGPPAISKAKMPQVGSSSSVPFRVRELKQRAEAAQRLPVGGSSLVQQSRARDLKDKAEATQRQSRVAETSRKPFECNAAMHLKGQSMNKSWDGPDTTSFLVLPDTAQSSNGLMRNKGKSVSLAVQAKVNVQRREGISSSVAKSSGGQRERNGEVKTLQFLPNSQKGAHKKSPTHRASGGVLTQNNQKQNNCIADKNRLSSKPSISVSQGRKTLSGDSSFGRHKTTSSQLSGTAKAGSRKMGLESSGDGNEVLYSNSKNFPRKKRIIDRESISEKNHAIDLGGFTDKYSGKANESNPSKDSRLDWAEDSRKKGMDVVSFTFTAPMTRSMPGSEPMNTDRTKLSSSSSLGYNVIGSDALSILLEQKLREITIGVRSSRGDSIESDSTTSSSSALQHFSPTTSDVTVQSNVHDKKNTQGLFIDRLRTQFDGEFSSNNARLPKFQGVDEMDECSSSSINQAEAKHVFDRRNPSPVSILEPSFSTTESSSDSNGKSNQYSSLSIQTREAIDLDSFKNFNSYEAAETEIFDSASSASIKPWTRKHKIAFNWELEYMKEILCNVELMFNEYALGRTSKILNPRLFYQLENQRSRFDSNNAVSQAERKVLFDCVGECLDIRCRTWAKGLVIVKNKERLAEDMFKEISSWDKMGDDMVDELVDKDMSSHYGKWADFEIESFEIGVEMEAQIFNSMVNDLVADILRRR